MILVFILLIILIMFFTLIFFIVISTLHIEIRNLEATNIKGKLDEKREVGKHRKHKKEKANEYAIIISFYLFNKMKWLSIRLNDEKLRKTYTKLQLEKFDMKKLEQDFKWKDLKSIKKMQPKLSYLNLKMELGVESPEITAFLISIISAIIAISLQYFAIGLENNNYNYQIIPIYENKNLYKVQFNCVIQIKVIHIINVVYLLISSKIAIHS